MSLAEAIATTAIIQARGERKTARQIVKVYLFGFDGSTIAASLSAADAVTSSPFASAFVELCGLCEHADAE